MDAVTVIALMAFVSATVFGFANFAQNRKAAGVQREIQVNVNSHLDQAIATGEALTLQVEALETLVYAMTADQTGPASEKVITAKADAANAADVVATTGGSTS